MKRSTILLALLVGYLFVGCTKKEKKDSCILTVDIIVTDVDSVTKTLTPKLSGTVGSEDKNTYRWETGIDYLGDKKTLTVKKADYTDYTFTIEVTDEFECYATATEVLSFDTSSAKGGLTINYIEVTYFETTNKGAAWDGDGSAADLRISLTLNANPNPIWMGAEIIPDQSSYPVSFSGAEAPFPYHLSKPDTIYNIFLWDDDMGSNIYLGSNWFNPSSFLTHPDTLMIDWGPTENPKFKLHVTWD